MEKTVIQTKHEFYPPQSFPSTLCREATPALVTTPKSAPAVTVSVKHEHPASKGEASPAHAHNLLPSTVPPAESSRYDAPLPPIPPRRTLLGRLRTRYTSLPKRTCYILFTSVLLVVALIIGLGAGLGARANSHFSHLPLPSSHGGPYTGDLTYYDPGLGACGITSTGADYIVAVSHLVFDAVSVGSNPNADPLCGKKIRASRGGKSVDLTVVDRCVGCQASDLDVTRTVFQWLADIDLGRVSVSWAWLEDVPAGAVG